jgi:hypothetical protein
MKNLHVLGCALSLVVASLSLAHGQEATERYLPIGQSPGQSGKTTTIGTVAAVDVQARSISVTADGQAVNFGWTLRTRIWLDRSRQQLGALKGSESDILVGRRVEVSPGKTDRSVLDWIKVDPGVAPN